MRLQSTQYETSREWREWGHAVRKAVSTVKILYRLGMARTFGVYVHSVWNGELDYAVYLWRGKMWAIPTTPIESD